MQKKVPAVFMRGGTSKAVFFHANHLPQQGDIRNQVILAAYGSPDPNSRQIDGVGGGVSTTSKAAIISRSTDPAYDVVYNFAQVSIDRPIVDTKGNCGNISTAVGPFAVDEGLVPAQEPVTTVRIHQKNTNTLIIAEVPVKNGCFDETGNYAIAGVPGTGAKITLRFIKPGGAVTGKLFPTENTTDTLDVSGLGDVRVTIIDAANPVVLVPASEVGLKGTEINEIDSYESIRDRLEAVRSKAAVAINLAASPKEASRFSQAVPKIALVSPPQSYTAATGEAISANSLDLTGRMMSMGTLHRSYAVSGAISTVGAALVEGTVVREMLPPRSQEKQTLVLGHPGGTIEIGAVMNVKDGKISYREAILGRTARRLMEGHVLVPEHCFQKKRFE